MKVADLQGAELDAAIARIEGIDHEVWNGECWFGDRFVGIPYQPSTAWRDGGPIIDKMPRIRIQQNADGYAVQIFKDENCLIPTYGYGETILIAAMRCYVASHYGPEVPDEKEQP